ncbi:hypothetical protein TorRG33x02_242120 [Trema orientale]|uniref:Uncharacterized protein n=1 Tax=Trema orientale TaxID=63057 RepID=A0A2P5DTZ8_TREOI|nr:hypothetical protein TorRG33x02_242120 [Trema orientale]
MELQQKGHLSHRGGWDIQDNDIEPVVLQDHNSSNFVLIVELGELESISYTRGSQSEQVQNSDDVIYDVEEDDFIDDNVLDHDNTMYDYIENEEELEMDDDDETDQDEHEDYIDSDDD